MMARPRRRAFTLIELLVVIGIIALLMAILLPSLSKAREQGRRVYCLANLRSIAQAAVAYAGDDRKDLIIPIHQSMVTPMSATDYWLRRTAIWFACGGRSAPQPFLTDNGPVALDEESSFAARTRPLNRYLYGDIMAADEADMDLFRCPSDRGYPYHEEIDDAPIENAERTCYDTLGSSYRASLYGIFSYPYEEYDGAFAIGPWGHKLSSIPTPSQVPIFGEPTFFNMIGMDNGVANPPAVIATGWHGQWMKDNLAYADGSARTTRAEGHETLSAETSARMDLGSNWHYISRGPGWRFDLWPTPGARIWAADPTNALWNPPYTAHPDPQHWPFAGAQDNLRGP